MILKVIIEDQLYELNVPHDFQQKAQDFYDQLDRDMDSGWQMSREWVKDPTREQRIQIVADKLLSALEKENHKVGRLMAGYILARMPEIESVEPDLGGEIQNTRIVVGESRPAAPVADTPPSPPAAAPSGGLSKMDALEQAGQDVTKVFKVGRNWRFSVYDHASGQWRDSPLVADEEEAERLRQEAFKERYEALLAG